MFALTASIRSVEMLTLCPPMDAFLAPSEVPARSPKPLT